MPDTNDIDGLLGYLRMASAHQYGTILSDASAKKYHASLTALVAERDVLRRRVAAQDADLLAAANAILHGRLEGHPPADRDRELRERLDTTLAWMAHVTDMLIRLPHTDHARIELENRLDRAVNAAMRKGDGDGK